MLFTFHERGLDTGLRCQHFGQESALVLEGSMEDNMTQVISINSPPRF